MNVSRNSVDVLSDDLPSSRKILEIDARLMYICICVCVCVCVLKYPTIACECKAQDTVLCSGKIFLSMIRAYIQPPEDTADCVARHRRQVGRHGAR